MKLRSLTLLRIKEKGGRGREGGERLERERKGDISCGLSCRYVHVERK